MMNHNCPSCGSSARLIMVGTVSVAEYFQRPGAYTITSGEHQDRLPLYKCARCGHGFTPITIDPSSITEWYAKAPRDEVFLGDEAARRKTAETLLKRIEARVPKGRLLDVGAGPGVFVAVAVGRGWQAVGLDPSAWAVDHARDTYGVEMIQGDISALQNLPPQAFDVVTLFDVIEHVVNPELLLENSSRVLTSRGLVVLTTPRFDSFVARRMGRRWYCIFPAHLHYFTHRSLQAALEKAGFTSMAARSHTRYLSRSYLWDRVQGLFGYAPSSPTRQQSASIPVNLGDEFEVYAYKEKS